MAKPAVQSRAIVVRQPAAKAPIINIRGPALAAKAKAAAKSAGRAALHRAQAEKHTLGAVMAGAALGYAERSKMQLPHVASLGVAGTYGIAAWMASKHLRSRTLSHVATGLLTIAAYQFARGGAAGVSGPEVLPLG